MIRASGARGLRFDSGLSPTFHFGVFIISFSDIWKVKFPNQIPRRQSYFTGFKQASNKLDYAAPVVTQLVERLELRSLIEVQLSDMSSIPGRVIRW